MRPKLPPLNALRIFEVAARAESYSAAARELNLTHGAVSRQIAILEDWLGQPLFVRDGQSMVASPQARALAREITASLDHIADATERYGNSRRSKIIRVSAPATLAMRWLIPRLSSFAAKCPDVDVRVSTVLSTEPAFKGSFDVAIRRDIPSGNLFEAWPLFRESNTVIASPQLLSRTGLITVEQLGSETWLTSETRPDAWTVWVDAANCPALRANRTLRFDHFFVTLQAVSDGLGFGIGPFPTLEADCASGRLQRPFPELLAQGSTYYALAPHDADRPVHIRAFVDWLKSVSSGN
jgi:LysR family transcriptional regulator, glycine cleavage system transcriptional activator